MDLLLIPCFMAIEQYFHSVFILLLLIQSGEIGQLRDNINLACKLTIFALEFDLLRAALTYFPRLSTTLVQYVGFYGSLQSGVVAAAT